LESRVIPGNALRYFAEVVRSGSLRAASERLFVAASAISRQISLLEEEVGAPLIERSRGRAALKLTAAGESLMRYVVHADHEFERVRFEIESLKGLRKGKIRLGIPETFARDSIPGFLSRFNQKYPGISYEIECAGSPRLVELVGQDALDLVIAFNPPAVLHVKHVYQRQLATRVLVAEDHPLASKTHVRLSDCADYGIAYPDARIGAKGLDEMFAKAGIKPRKTLVSNSYDLLRSVAREGLALAIVNARVGEPLQGPGYRYIPIKDPRVKPQHLTLSIFDGRNPSPITAIFIEQLKEEFDRLE
jgi:DNA-binding transcriptional LysR family regulator